MGQKLNEKPTQAKLKRRFLRGCSKIFSFGQIKLLSSNKGSCFVYIYNRKKLVQVRDALS
jgi:hypothetical protein